VAIKIVVGDLNLRIVFLFSIKSVVLIHDQNGTILISNLQTETMRVPVLGAIIDNRWQLDARFNDITGLECN
jgi:hypothetical protein